MNVEVNIKAIALRVFHTFWQSFVAVFALGIMGILSSLLQTHNISDAKTALIALVVAACAAGLSALKNIYLTPPEAR